MKTIVILILMVISTMNISAQEKWKLAKNKNGIRVYISKVPGSDYYAFKAIMSVKTTENDVVKILKNVNKYPDWFAFTASTKLISRGGNKQLFFMETDYLWPYSNEGMNYSMKFVKSKEGQQKITIIGSNKDIKCKHSLKKASGYILLRQDEGYLEISYYFHSESSQNIPTWLINPMIHEMPYQTFTSLKKMLKA